MSSSVTTWGCGLRPHHYPSWHALGSRSQEVEVLEVLTDNFLFQKGGPGLGHVQRITKDKKVLLHGVGMDVCGTDPLSSEYLRGVKDLMERLEPQVVSDHLCYTRAGGYQSYDLLPIPYTRNNLSHIASRIQKIQESLKIQFTVENVSSYISFRNSEMTEFEFLSELCNSTGCAALLDVNNLFVNSFNFKFDPFEQLQLLKPDQVNQIHVAGHTEMDDFLHDTHNQPVRQEVWKLLQLAVERFGTKPVILERDDEQTPLNDILAELELGRELLKSAANCL